MDSLIKPYLEVEAWLLRLPYFRNVGKIPTALIVLESPSQARQFGFGCDQILGISRGQGLTQSFACVIRGQPVPRFRNREVRVQLRLLSQKQFTGRVLRLQFALGAKRRELIVFEWLGRIACVAGIVNPASDSKGDL